MLKKSLPLNIINQASSEKSMDTLVYFLWLRCKFKKPIFYNYNVRKIASHLNISPTTASKQIKKMLSYGWAVERNGHLCLQSNNKLRDGSPIILIPVSFIKREQVIFFRYSLIRSNTDSQTKQILGKSAIVKHAKTYSSILSKKQLLKIKKAGGVKKIERSFQDRITLSNKKIGKILNRSQSSGARYQSQFRQLNLIKSYSEFEVVQYDLFNDSIGRVTRSRKNGLFYRQLSNTIIPLQ